MTSIRAQLAAYDRYLQRKAEEGPLEARQRAIYDVMLPWLVPAGATAIIPHLPMSRHSQTLVMLLLILVAAVGLSCASYRFTKHGWRFARTPRPALWTELPFGQILIEELRRSTLRGLTDVTLDTRLRRDLKLTGSEVSSFLTALSKAAGQDLSLILQRDGQDLEVRDLLAAMSQDPSTASSGSGCNYVAPTSSRY